MMVLLGYLVWGGALGYAFERWLAVRVLVFMLAGIGIIMTGSLSIKLGTTPDALSWWNTAAFIVGFFVGGRIAAREESV